MLMDNSCRDPNDVARGKVLNLAFTDVRDTLNERHPDYKDEPVMYMPIESWLHQIRIKSERALQSNRDDKTIDEVRDLVGYGIFVLGRLLVEKEEKESMMVKCACVDPVVPETPLGFVNHQG